MSHKLPAQRMLPLPRLCEQCSAELPLYIRTGKTKTVNRHRFCSNRCVGANKRGKARGNTNAPAKNHIRISKNGKRVYLHRDLFETHVRPLQDGEIVHHKDDNKFNNTIENLEAIKDQGEHLREHYRSRSGAFRRSPDMNDCPF